jgi:hypothetical protein
MIPGMKGIAAVVGFVLCGPASPGAVQLMLDRRAIEEAIYIGQSRIESERTRLHAPYRVRVARPPVDWIDVITPFHRVALAAEINARRGGRQFGQREAMDVLRDAAHDIDLLIEMSFHPLNTFVAMPSYDVEIALAGGQRAALRRVDRLPRFGPRSESIAPALPARGAAAPGGGQLAGGTIVAVLDGTSVDPNQRVEVVVLEGANVLARAAIDLAKMR